MVSLSTSASFAIAWHTVEDVNFLGSVEAVRTWIRDNQDGFSVPELGPC